MPMTTNTPAIPPRLIAAKITEGRVARSRAFHDMLRAIGRRIAPPTQGAPDRAAPDC